MRVCSDALDTSSVGSVSKAMFVCSKLMTEQFSALVNDLMNPTIVIKSPMFRFCLNFLFFITRVFLQNAVLRETYTELSTTAAYPNQLVFSQVEICHALISTGFFMTELQEVKTASVSGGISKATYWASFWNKLDWVIQGVFFAYMALKIVSINYSRNGDFENSEK